MEFTRIASEAEVEGRMSERSIFRNQLSRRTGLLLVLPISVCEGELLVSMIFGNEWEQVWGVAYEEQEDAREDV
jgi:hypothetical protein